MSLLLAAGSAPSGTALTGNTTATAAGTLGLELGVSQTGVSASASTGSVGASITVALSGNAATTTQGGVSPSVTVALTGNSATSSAGTLTSSVSGGGITLSSNSATASVGTVVPGVSLAITGNGAAASAGALGVGAADVKVSWLQFDTAATPVDVRVSWLQFDTASTPCDVRVSWICFDTAAANQSGDGGRLYKPRKFYIRRKGKILLFDTAEQADAYAEAEEIANAAIEKAKSRGAKKRVVARVFRDVPEPIEVIGLSELETLIENYKLPYDMGAILMRNDYAQVIDIQAIIRRLQDDEDEEFLLLFA